MSSSALSSRRSRARLSRGPGSFVIHPIVNDDVDKAHRHPWNFTVAHRPLTLIRRRADRRHRVLLHKLFGYPIPCLTVGRYSPKLQPWCEHRTLCDFCAPVGECSDKAYWKSRHQQESG